MKRLLRLSTLFCTIAAAQAEILLSDSFNYPDGPLVSVSGGKWLTYSGTAGQANVDTGRLFLTQSRTEGINSVLAGAPIHVASPVVLYSGFTVSFTSLPTGDGDCFAHFAGTGSVGRVFVTTNGAAPGSFRLGIARTTGDPSQVAFLPRDLSLNTPYTVVTRYWLAGGFSSLWVNPASELDDHVNDSDILPVTSSISTYAFRQSETGGNGMGSLFVDDLRVGRTFADALVIPEPSTICLTALGAIVIGILRAGQRQ